MSVLSYIYMAVGALAMLALAHLYNETIDNPFVRRQALAGYVLLSEKTALESQLTEMERQKNAAAQSLEEYRKRAVADALMQQKLEAQLEQAINDDNQNADDGDYRWSDADRLWLCKQRQTADCSR